MSSEDENITDWDETSISSNTTAVLSSATTVNADENFVAFYSLEVKLVFVTLACVSTLSSLAAVTFMHRSKKIPYAAKFMTTGLLLFDVLFLLLSTIRKFITDPIVCLHVLASTTIVIHLANLTVGLMSLERCFLFLKPMRYIRIATKKFIRKTVITIWLCDVCLCFFVRYGVCYIKYRSISVFVLPGFCKNITPVFYAISLLIVLVTAITCYVEIFKCIRSKTRPGQASSVTETAQIFRSYRSTSITFIFLLVIIFSIMAYCGSFIILNLTQHLQYTIVSFEIVFIINCILDPFLYVFWFKECRMECVMFLAVFLKRYRQKAEQMRIDVYNIVTVQTK